jgi:hypothetical protein
MFWTDLKLPSPFCLVVFMEQLMTLGVDHGDNDSTARYFASMKSKVTDEKAIRKKDKDELQTLARACYDLKKMADKFSAQVLELEGLGWAY